MIPRRPNSGTGILPVRPDSHERNTPAPKFQLEYFSKEISEKAGQTCGFATNPGRDSLPFRKFLLRNTIVRLPLLLSALFAVAAMEPPSQPITLPPEQAAKEGRALVDEMLSQPPDESTTTGVLAIRTKKNYKEIPIKFQTIVTPTNWVSVYSTAGADRSHYVNLKVVHTDGRPNRYLVANINPPPTDTNQFRELKSTALFSPFVDDSDFSIADLGLEFLHWPDQKLSQKEMKRSRSCRVLESTNPNPRAGGYAKVKSWVDNESHGILLAQAFDVKGNKIKEFTPGDFSKSKATGQWQLGKMQISNFQTDSSTTVRFDVDK